MKITCKRAQAKTTICLAKRISLDGANSSMQGENFYQENCMREKSQPFSLNNIIAKNAPSSEIVYIGIPDAGTK